MNGPEQRKGGIVPNVVPKLCGGVVLVLFAGGPLELEPEDVVSKRP